MFTRTHASDESEKSRQSWSCKGRGYSKVVYFGWAVRTSDSRADRPGHGGGWWGGVFVGGVLGGWGAGFGFWGLGKGGKGTHEGGPAD